MEQQGPHEKRGVVTVFEDKPETMMNERKERKKRSNHKTRKEAAGKMRTRNIIMKRDNDVTAMEEEAEGERIKETHERVAQKQQEKGATKVNVTKGDEGNGKPGEKEKRVRKKRKREMLNSSWLFRKLETDTLEPFVERSLHEVKEGGNLLLK